YALVLMDWQMPDVDGVEATRRIGSQSALQHQPEVVIVTAFGAEEVRDAGERAGASAFLDKPVSQSRLWDALVGLMRPLQAPIDVSELAQHSKQLEGVHVLLVEDNNINQQIATEMMQGLGVQVSVAENGQQALDMLLQAVEPLPWDLVFMDLQMPVMDGHQATQALRRHERFRNLPIVAMTAHASVEEGARCLAEGMNEHLTKPIDPQALQRCLVRWCRSSTKPDYQRLTISDLDQVQGLRNCAGKPALYQRMVRQFADTMADAPAVMRAAMKDENWSQAIRTSHTLRGVAANIGAKACSDLAAQIESALAQPQTMPAVEALLVQLEQHLRPLVAEIGFAFPAEAVTAEPTETAFDPTAFDVACRGLAVLLAGCDAESEHFLRQNEALLKAGLGDAFASIRGQVVNFDFSAALDELRQAAALSPD
ncbi:MAG: response regulator, partial [Rhodoferax sp.]